MRGLRWSDFRCTMRDAVRVAITLARLSPLLKSRLAADGAVIQVIVMCTEEPIWTACDFSSVELA
jgi:hypothetical protein